jgi:iron complex outermembrane recepter protein
MLRKVLMVGVYAAALSAAVPRVILADEPEASDALEEITVTAEKSTQNLQKTAAAVTVVSADQLINNGITDLRQAQQLVPSVRFQAEGNNTQVFIRGVGSNLDEGNVEPSVAFNIAGIYVPREATSAGFFDLEQLEVLPGPQGTLYGRSAIGGTVNVTPTRPGFDSEGSSLLEVGNYAAVHGTVTQDFKASDTIAFRAAIDYSKNQGFETTGADSKNDVSGRLSTLIKPNDRLSIYLWTQAAGEYGYAMNAVNKGTDPNTGAYCEQCFLSSNPWNDTRTGALAGPFGIPTKEANHYTSAIVGGQIDYRFDGVTLSYLPSYLYLDTHPSYWLSAILTSNSADYNQITQELRLASTGVGPLQWLGGLYFYHQRNSSENYLYVPVPVLQDSVPYDRLQGYAAFGQATYSFTDTFRATVGGRASKTERTAHGDEPLGLGGLPYSFDQTFNHIDWKAALEKDLLPKVMLYGAVQTGYQPGTFNELPDTPTFNNEVQPTKLEAYSAGVKSRWLDDRLQINNEVYYYDYRDLLIQSYNIAAIYNTIFNAQKVAIKGDQLDVLAKVFKDDQFNFSIGYSHARNVEFITPSGQNYDGLQPAYAPDLTGLAGYTHNIPIGNATLRAHIDWRYESSWWANYVHSPGVLQVPSNKGDAYLTYDVNTWTVGVWVKNIQNRPVMAASAAAGIPGPGTGYLDDPRTFGLRFTAKY